MAFDGIGYRDARLGFPNLYHPHAPLIGPAYGNALRTAYCYAENHGRRILDQHYSVNFRDPAGFLQGRVAIIESAFTRVAEGFRYIPDATTHLVAECLFNISDADNETEAHHRLSVSDGTHTDVGDDLITQIAVQPASVAGSVPPVYSPFGSNYNRYRARCDVALGNVAAGAVREVWVDAYALRGVKHFSSTVAAAYFPEWIGVWIEIR